MDKKTKVLLIVPPVIYARQPSIGIAYLCSYLRNKDCEVRCWDLNTRMQILNDGDDVFWAHEENSREFFMKNKNLFESWVEEVLNYDPQIVGFSVWSTSQYSSLRLAEMIKKRDKNKLIVFGGVECNFDGKQLIKNPAVDILVCGEGEKTLAEIAEKYASNGRVELCEGTLIKKDAGIIDCGARPPIENLDELPFPDFTDFQFEKYLYKDYVPISFGRGCIWRCAFCEVSHCWNKFRTRSAKSIYSEMKYRLENRRDTFCPEQEFIVCDPSLDADLNVLSELCDMIIGDGLPVRFNGLAQIRPAMDFEFLKKMKKAGCELLDFGLESGSQRVLDKMGKKYSVMDAERVIKDAHNAGINVILNFVVGFPNEREEDFYETLEFIRRVKDSVLYIAPGHPCIVHPYSRIYQNLKEFGVILGTERNNWRTADGENNKEERERRARIFDDFVTNLGIIIRCGEDDREMESKKTVASKDGPVNG